MDEFFIAFGTGMSPQRPGDGIQQRGLTRAVGSGQAGQVNAVEAQRIGRTIGEEIFQLKPDWNHNIVFELYRIVYALIFALMCDTGNGQVPRNQKSGLVNVVENCSANVSCGVHHLRLE